MRYYLKIAGIIPLLALYVLTACVCAILPAGARLRRKFLARNCSFFARLFLFLLNIRMQVTHRERAFTRNNGLLIVSNHLSYIDVLVIAALTPTVFITSVELGSTLVLGMLARLGGSMFVERRKPSGLRKEISMISHVLGQGHHVSLFPEGTTSNGDRVQKFKYPLFDAAVRTGADILPICLRYTRVNDERMSAHLRDKVYYYGGVSFFRHFPRLLSLRSVDVEVTLLKPIQVRTGVTRKELAAQAHHAISAAYHG